MRLKHLVGGQVSAAVLFSVPVLALLALAPWSSASNAGDTIAISSELAGDGELAVPRMNSDGLVIEDLSDWKYTGGWSKASKGGWSKAGKGGWSKAGKSGMSKKSGKSDKSKKSPKSKKSGKKSHKGW